MVRPTDKAHAPEGAIRSTQVADYPFIVLSILLLISVGATLAYYQNAAVFEDPSGLRWAPVVFLIGVCVSLVIFGMTHREASARAILQQKTRDLIEAKRQNESLLEAEQNARLSAERANLAKDEFLAVVSHELKTPLNAIAGWSRILKTRGLSPETQRSALEKIDKNLRIQTAIIDELLSFSDIVSGNYKFEKRPIRLRDVFEDATTAVSVAAFQKGITIVKKNELDDERVLGDPPRLRIALVNVLSNAVKFTPPGGNIDTRAFASSGSINWAVADDGEGMPPDSVPHI